MRSLATLTRVEELQQLAWVGLRLLAFLTLLGVAQWGLTRLAGLQHPGALCPELLSVEAVRDGDIVYFGDSVLIKVSRRDTDRRPLRRLLAVRLAPLRVAPIAHAAFHPLVFEAAADHLLRSDRRPRAFVVPINLRSFSVPWAARPSWQFAREQAVLRMTPGFGAAFVRARLAYKELPAPEPNPPLGELWRRADRRGLRLRFPAREPEPPESDVPSAADFMRMSYLGPLDARHPYLRALVALAQRARHAGVPTFFYVTPLDVQSVAGALGPVFHDELATRVSLLRETLAPAGGAFHDWSARLAPADFDWMESGAINEHLSRPGRARLARLLARELRDFLATGVTMADGD